MILYWAFVECGQRPPKSLDTSGPAEDLRQSVFVECGQRPPKSVDTSGPAEHSRQNSVIVVKNNFLPIELRSFACGLKITGSGELSITDYGGQFSIEKSIDPL
ncbi:MAG: hypothetical protein IT271_15115 [Chitinophagales bacterium]|nr:hypothetical protein [Chitinophagales bacterium]